MRWTDLFDDLEAQLAAQEAAELRGEIVEHTRTSLGQVTLGERYLADLGTTLHLMLRGGPVVEGTLDEVGQEWIVLGHQDGARARESLVATANVVTVRGLSGRSDPGRPGQVQRRLGLRQVLRAVSRDRSVVRVHLVEGATLTGTIDRVGADHLDLSAHPADLPRRSGEIQSRITVPYHALVCLSRHSD